MPHATHPQRRHPLNSLATRFILFVFGATFATAAVVTGFALHASHEGVRRTLDTFYPRTLAQVERDLAPWLATAQADLEALAAGASGRGAKPVTERRLRQALEGETPWLGLACIDADGQREASVGHLPDHVAASASHVSLEDGSRHPVIWMPVPERGALLGVLDAAALTDVLTPHLPSPESRLLVLDAFGSVILASGSPLPADAGRIDPPLETAGTRVYDTAGQPVIGAARALASSSWRLVVQTPYEPAFAPVFEIATRMFVVDLLAILVFSVLGYRITSAVVRPIERLSDWSRNVARGQDDLELPDTRGHDELGLLARTFNDMVRQQRRNQEEIETANRSLLDRNLRLQQANEILNQLSITDGLTKLHNHRFFQDQLTREIKRVSRTGDPLAMLLIDIDDFKQLNDRFGHAAGDEMLVRLAPILNATVRETDLVARYGGEEFVVLALNTDVAGAYALGEKLRYAIAESSFILDDSLRPLRITVSVGVALFRGSRKRFFQRADEALYRAKAQGKNCVVLDEQDAESLEDDGA